MIIVNIRDLHAKFQILTWWDLQNHNGEIVGKTLIWSPISDKSLETIPTAFCGTPAKSLYYYIDTTFIWDGSGKIKSVFKGECFNNLFSNNIIFGSMTSYQMCVHNFQDRFARSFICEYLDIRWKVPSSFYGSCNMKILVCPRIGKL